jgi:hypothetical protein
MSPVRRGDLFLARLDPTVGSEQVGVRPVLVVQSDLANRYFRTFFQPPFPLAPRRNSANSPSDYPPAREDSPGTPLFSYFRSDAGSDTPFQENRSFASNTDGRYRSRDPHLFWYGALPRVADGGRITHPTSQGPTGFGCYFRDTTTPRHRCLRRHLDMATLQVKGF